MDRAEWNGLADDFEDLVCDVTVDETNDQMRRFVGLAKPSPQKSVLVDLGCGIGSFILRFGRRFREIVAVEYAPRTIARARERCAEIEGVEWLAMDAARAAERIGPRADLTVCLNLITSASASVRKAQWQAVAAVTKPGGHALLVVPSLESDRMVQASGGRLGTTKHTSATAEGLADRDGSLQKHYSREELGAVLAASGFQSQRVGRIYTSWATEGLDRPRSGNFRGPWDWICLARKA